MTFRVWSSPLASTRILGRPTAPFPPFRIPHRVPRGFTQYPGTDRSQASHDLPEGQIPGLAHERASLGDRNSHAVRILMQPPSQHSLKAGIDARAFLRG